MQRSDLSVPLRSVFIIAVIVAFYWGDLAAIFASAWVDPDFSYLIAVPFLFLYLIYRKRKVLSAIIRNPSEERDLDKKKLPSISGVLLCTMSVFLYFYGSITFAPIEYHMITLPVFAAGLVLIFFDYSTLRQLLFPLVFLCFMVPPPASILDSASGFLADVSAHASSALVSFFGMPSTVAYYAGSPNVIMTDGSKTVATFIVDFTCSGINGLITFAVFTFFLAYIVRDKLWKKIAIVAIGLPLIYSMNILRISSVLAIGFHYGTGVAESIFHNFTGLILAFFGALLLTIIAQKALKTNFYGSSTLVCATCSNSKNQGKVFCESCGRILKKAEARIKEADLKKMAAISCIIIVLMLIQAPIYALARTQTNLLEQVNQNQTPSINILPQISNYNLSFSFDDKEFALDNQQDATLTYSYNPNNASAETVWVVLEIASGSLTMHAWETCLIYYPLSQGYQAPATQLDLKYVQIMQNPPITARVFAFRWNEYNVTQVVVYWDESLIFASNSSVEQKTVQISLCVFPGSSSQVPQAEAELETIAKAVDSYWEPIKTWTPVALLFSQYANFLAAATLVTAVSTASFFYITGFTKKTSRLAYSKITEKDKKVLAALNTTQQLTIATVGNIVITFGKLNSQQIDETDLAGSLEGLASLGLVHRAVQNVNDNPVSIWRSNFRP